MQASFRSSSIVAQVPNEVLALEQTLIRRAKRKVRQSNLRTRFERAFEAIFMHQSLDSVAPRQERILEAQLSKLDTHGHWRQRRVILSSKRLFICSSKSGSEKRGVMSKCGHQHKTFQARYFELMDGGLTYWKDEQHYISKVLPRGTVSVIGCEITVVEGARDGGYEWFITERGTGRVFKFSNPTLRLRSEWTAAISHHLQTLAEEEVLDSVPSAEIALLRPLDCELFSTQLQHSDRHRGCDSQHLPGFAPGAATNYQYAEGHTFGIVIETIEAGFNSGRVFVFKCKDREERDRWRDTVDRQREYATTNFRTRLDKIHHFFWKIAASLPMRVLTATLVLASFVSAVVSAQMRPEESSSAHTILLSLDNIFTFLFLAEMLIHFLARGRKFFQSAWLNFDACIVFASVVQLMIWGKSNNELRVLRSLQLLRSFQFSRLKVIAMALVASIVPVLQSAVLALITMSLYCLIGVEIFGSSADKEFGSFTSGFYTLFRVGLGSWPDEVPALSPFHEDGSINLQAIVFIYSYYLIVVIVLINLVVAVLLDNFFRISESIRRKDIGERMERERELEETNFPLDSLLEHLAANFTSVKELEEILLVIHHRLDFDRSGSVTREKLAEGLCRLRSAVHESGVKEMVQQRQSGQLSTRLSQEEFETLASGFHDENGDLGAKAFASMMTWHLQEFIQRKLSDAVKYHELAAETNAILMCSKLLLLQSICNDNLPSKDKTQHDSAGHHMQRTQLHSDPDQHILSKFETGAAGSVHTFNAGQEVLGEEGLVESMASLAPLDSQVEAIGNLLQSLSKILPYESIAPQISKLESVIEATKQTCRTETNRPFEKDNPWTRELQPRDISGDQEGRARNGTKPIGHATKQHRTDDEGLRRVLQASEDERKMIGVIEPSPRPYHDGWKSSLFVSPPGRPPTTEYFRPPANGHSVLSCELGTIARPETPPSQESAPRLDGNQLASTYVIEMSSPRQVLSYVAKPSCAMPLTSSNSSVV